MDVIGRSSHIWLRSCGRSMLMMFIDSNSKLTQHHGRCLSTRCCRACPQSTAGFLRAFRARAFPSNKLCPTFEPWKFQCQLCWMHLLGSRVIWIWPLTKIGVQVIGAGCSGELQYEYKWITIKCEFLLACFAPEFWLNQIRIHLQTCHVAQKTCMSNGHRCGCLTGRSIQLLDVQQSSVA